MAVSLPRPADARILCALQLLIQFSDSHDTKIVILRLDRTIQHAAASAIYY
jgi:hypothetical protein